MILDINTLLVVTVVNIVVLAMISPAVMGLRVGPAAGAARWALITHAAAWLCMIFSNFRPETMHDRILSTLAVGGFAATHWLMFRAFADWLGPRRFERGVRLLAVVIPTGYFFVFDSYALRVGWANFLLAIQIVLVAVACFSSKTSIKGAWRMVVAGGSIIMAVLTLGRGILGAFTDLYPSFLTPHPWNIAAMMMTSLMPVVINFAILGGWHEEAESALHAQAITDALTGLHNRRGWLEVALPLVANAARNHLSIAMLMIDIDYFKRINDTHGHDEGDRTLQVMGRLLTDHRRGSDVAARIGGEEFCLLLPGADANAARDVDQLLRRRLAAAAAELRHPVDFSSGLAILRPNESLEQLMIRADDALYRAKQGGRGRLIESDTTNPHNGRTTNG